MSIEATQQLAARYGDAWAKHDLDAILAMHTQDTVFHLQTGFSEPATGLAAAREVIAATFARSPDLRFEEEQGLHRRWTLRQRVSDEWNFGGQVLRVRGRRCDRSVRRSYCAEGHIPRLGGDAAATRCGADSFAIADDESRGAKSDTRR